MDEDIMIGMLGIYYNVFKRDGSGGALKTNARIEGMEGMLDGFGPSGRIATPDGPSPKTGMEPIDYERVGKTVNARRKESMGFLKKALEMEEK